MRTRGLGWSGQPALRTPVVGLTLLTFISSTLLPVRAFGGDQEATRASQTVQRAAEGPSVAEADEEAPGRSQSTARRRTAIPAAEPIDTRSVRLQWRSGADPHLPCRRKRLHWRAARRADAGLGERVAVLPSAGRRGVHALLLVARSQDVAGPEQERRVAGTGRPARRL